MSTISGIPAALATPTAAPAALGFEKTKCERQLADWVHCVSAKTPEGKAKIDELTSKLSQIAAQTRAAEDAKQQARAPAPAAPPAAAGRAEGTLGQSLDVYA